MLSIFNKKRVLVTGHTGFKGSWLTAWLLQLGAEVIGLSIDIPTEPSHFYVAQLDKRITNIFSDVRDFSLCQAAIYKHRPDFVFHLAAQPLVRKSYIDPLATFEVNMLGTLNMLESLRKSNHPCTAVFITSDKCYDNIEQLWGYRENDKLGGKDPYSGSKGAAELVIRSYAESYFANDDSHVKVAVGRAGNVIGGGDWAEDRIFPDIMRSWSQQEMLFIRNKQSTRPWQHVLEPISGYLVLASTLALKKELNGEAFNFGPDSDQNFTVGELLTKVKEFLPDLKWEEEVQVVRPYEANLLKLCCDKSLHMLEWKPSLTFNENISLTTEWYNAYYSGKTNMSDVTSKHIAKYIDNAKQNGAVWA